MSLPSRVCARHSKAGFTLVELGIVVGVIAILTTIVFTARGFMDASRVGTSVQLASAIRDAARGWAKRTNGGAAYAVTGPPLAPLAMADLVGPNNFFETTPRDPWDNQPVTVDGANPPAFDFIDIGICIGSGSNSAPLADDFDVSSDTLGTVIVGGPCGTGGTLVTLRTR